jgi:lipopolysaccharide transport system ATP-binding protein
MILEGRPKTVTGQYQRLANASAEAAADIRAQILAMRDAPAEAASPVPVQLDALAEPGEMTAASQAGAPVPTAEVPDGATPPPAREDDGFADYFDPGLVSQSMVALEERGARISNVRITTLHGDPVNVLRTGKRYVFEYHVDFSVDARDVGFGMFIRTVDGHGLAGVQTIGSRTQRTPRVSAGSHGGVRVEFSCTMLSGSYFFNCGIFGTVGSGQIVMHRLADALMIRVAAEADLIATGRVDIGGQLTFEETREVAPT